MHSSLLEIGLNEKPVHLHITHSWGGGIERWLRDFCATDTSCTNVVLRSLGRAGIPGERLALYNGYDLDKPVCIWELKAPIYVTSIAQLRYRHILDEIIKGLKIDSVLISSFIGHSLDVLNTGLKTIVICHDYYPFCPFINIYLNEVCTECGFNLMQYCFRANKHKHLFPWMSAGQWILIRKNYLKLIGSNKIILVVPSESVKNNLTKLDSSFERFNFITIPHGIELSLSHTNKVCETERNDDKLKILVLGSLSWHKGLGLLKEVIKESQDIANIFLLGCGETGRDFRDIKGVHVVAENYSINDLAELVENISPDVGMLLSIWPETYSYTLSELMILNIPVLATKLGSFEERIQDGISGFLVEPDKDSLLKKIRELNKNRELILYVKNNLKSLSHRSTRAMLLEYHKVFETVFSSNESSEEKKLSLIDMLHDEITCQQSHVGKLHIDLDSTKAALDSTKIDLDSTKAALDSTKIDLDSTKAALDSTKIDLDSTKAALDSTKIDLDSTKAALDSTKIDLDSTKAALDSTKAALDSTKANLESANTTIVWMESSKFWKLRTLWFKFKNVWRNK